MTILKRLPIALLAVCTAACGPGGESGDAESAMESSKSGAETPGTELPDPERALRDAEDQSETVWELIQENHGKLTDQQQRALQACAELAVTEEDIAAEKAVSQCRKEMEQLAREQQSSEGDEREDSGNQDSSDG